MKNLVEVSSNSSTYGASSAGFTVNNYWSSSQADTGLAWAHQFDGGLNRQTFADKSHNYVVRPIRAF